MTATVVVTGAGGFVGSALRAALAHRGVRVIGVSRRMLPGAFQVADYAQSPPGDVLFHLAEEPHREVVNARGAAYRSEAEHVMQALTDGRYQHLVYLSSGLVYGDAHSRPRTTDAPVFATDNYTAIKLANEATALAAGGTVVRVSNLFGAGMSSRSVIAEIMAQLHASGPVRVRNASPVRDFLAVADAVAALALLVPRRVSGILNLGSGIATSIGQLARMLLDLAGQSGRDVVSEASATGPGSVNVLDVSATIRALGWQPPRSLEPTLGDLLAARLRATP